MKDSIIVLMTSLPAALILGFILDQCLGDPRNWPHPVVGIGKVIDFLEERLNVGSPESRQKGGIILTLSVVGGSYLLTWVVVWGASALHPILGMLVSAYLIFTTLACKSLLDAGRSILAPLKKGDLSEARLRLSWFVSRDTQKVSEGEVVRGTIETLAENFVDGILSPLIYAAIGGAPLAMAFKAISTLDSMVGYKNDRFRSFGWFSARTDDWANYVPARLSVPILIFAGWIWRMPVVHAYKIWKRDAKSHPSPNGGNPESVVAGLLGIQLGGFNSYHGELHHRAEMGEVLHPMNFKDIMRCRQLIQTATWISIIPVVIISYLLY